MRAWLIEKLGGVLWADHLNYLRRSRESLEIIYQDEMDNLRAELTEANRMLRGELASLKARVSQALYDPE